MQNTYGTHSQGDNTSSNLVGNAKQLATYTVSGSQRLIAGDFAAGVRPFDSNNVCPIARIAPDICGTPPEMLQNPAFWRGSPASLHFQAIVTANFLVDHVFDVTEMSRASRSLVLEVSLKC